MRQGTTLLGVFVFIQKVESRKIETMTYFLFGCLFSSCQIIYLSMIAEILVHLLDHHLPSYFAVCVFTQYRD